MKKKYRIFVVEDDRTSRKLLSRMLEKEGYDVVECYEGRDAIHLATEWPPTAMLIDVVLPDMQGTEIIEALEEYPQCRHIKSLFLTGLLKKKAEDQKFHFKIKGINYRALPKPIQKPKLLSLLEEMVVEGVQNKKDFEKKQTTQEKKDAEEKAVLRAEKSAKKKLDAKKRGHPVDFPVEQEFPIDMELSEDDSQVEELNQSALWS